MRTFQFFLLCLVIPTALNAQESGYSFSDRIMIQTSFLARLPPITLYVPDVQIHEVHVLYNTSDQLSGPGVRLGFGYKFPKHNWWIMYSHSFRYNAVYYNRYYTQPLPNSTTVDVPVKSLIQDMTFSLSKGIQWGKYEPFLTVGGSFMNRGTYYRTATDFDTLGQQVIGTSYTTGDFKFNGLQTGIGFRHTDFMIEMNGYWVYQSVYHRNSIFCIPELRISYTIRKKLKQAEVQI